MLPKSFWTFIIGMVVGALAIVAGFYHTYNRSEPVTAPSPVIRTVTATPSPTASPTPTETESPVENDAKYGQALQLPEGLKVTVLHPTPYPKDPSVKMVKKYYKMFTVTVQNTTKTTIPHTEDWMVDSGTGELGNWKSGNGEFTNTEGNGMPGGKLEPGRALTFTVVFGYDENSVPKFSFATCPLDEVCKAYVWGA